MNVCRHCFISMVLLTSHGITAHAGSPSGEMIYIKAKCHLFTYSAWLSADGGYNIAHDTDR